MKPQVSLFRNNLNENLIGLDSYKILSIALLILVVLGEINVSFLTSKIASGSGEFN